MIRAIIFDCFGVLVGSSWEPFCKTYFKNDPVKTKRAKEYMDASNRGEISYEQFIQFIADESGLSYEETQRFMDSNPRNEGLLQYIRDELKQKYKIGFLSNASANWLDELFLPEDLKLFDAFVLSYETGYAKPQAQIYEIAAEKLDVRLDECVFIDDLGEYVEGAQAVGMKGILFENLDQLKADLEEVLA